MVLDKRVEITEAEFKEQIRLKIDNSRGKRLDRLYTAYYRQKELSDRKVKLKYYLRGEEIFFEIRPQYF